MDKKLKREIEAKIGQVRTIIDREKLGAVLLTQQYNVCWLTAGNNNHVLYDAQESLIGILITKSEAIVIAENGDLDRVRDEEFMHYPFEFRKAEWYEGGVMAEVPKLVSGKLGADRDVPGIEAQINVDGHLMHFRSVLCDSEIERLIANGKEASSIMTDVARETKPEMRESDVAAMLSERLVAHGFSVAVILIGGDERSFKYRHQVVTDHRIRRHFCFCGVGKKNGLTFPITRIVSFGDPPPQLETNRRKIETVYVYLNSLATAGTNLQDIYRKLSEVYRAAGIESDEWRNHTQGGTMGYHPREQTVCETVDYVIREHNVIGWNPSLPGIMAEDVYLLTRKGLDFITYDERWPHEEIHINHLTQARPRALIL